MSLVSGSRPGGLQLSLSSSSKMRSTSVDSNQNFNLSTHSAGSKGEGAGSSGSPSHSPAASNLFDASSTSLTGETPETYSLRSGGGGQSSLDDGRPPRAVVALLQHQRMKERLIEELQRGTERLSQLTADADVELESQSEYLKRSTINRKIITALKAQVKEERKRRDRLLQQRNSQKHEVLENLNAQIERQRKEIERYEKELGEKQATIRMNEWKLQRLKDELGIATKQNESVWRSGNRVLAAPKTNAELTATGPSPTTGASSSSSTSVRQAWLDTLRGITKEDKDRLRLAPLPSVMRRANATELIEASKRKAEYYLEEYRQLDADAEAQFATMKEVGKITQQAEKFLQSQRRAIAEVRFLQGIDTEYTLPPCPVLDQKDPAPSAEGQTPSAASTTNTPPKATAIDEGTPTGTT